MDQRFASDGKHKDLDTAMSLGFFLGPFGLLYIGLKQTALGFAILLPAFLVFEIVARNYLAGHLGDMGLMGIRIALWVGYAVGIGLYARSEAKRINDREFMATHPDYHLHYHGKHHSSPQAQKP